MKQYLAPIQGQSPVEQVRLIVPTTDDTTLPTLTFRVWIIGITGCIILSFVSVLTSFRQNPVDIPVFAIILVCYSLGKFMAALLPAKLVRVPGTKIIFSLNSGPFSIKEHILCWTIFTSGLGTPVATGIVVATRASFGRSLHPAAYFLLLFTTEVSTEHSPEVVNINYKFFKRGFVRMKCLVF
jgi:hypothetical protein